MKFCITETTKCYNKQNFLILDTILAMSAHDNNKRKLFII